MKKIFTVISNQLSVISKKIRVRPWLSVLAVAALFILIGAGAGKITNLYVISSANFDYATASELLATDASKNVVSLSVATYPSLTELSYVKGVTSAIQTQINGKQAAFTGSGTDYINTGGVKSNWPTFNQNTTGTAANLSGTPALPNGTTATTQGQSNNSTKLATTAYVDTGLATKQASLGYTAENSANKETSALDTSTTKYPCNNVVKAAVDLKQNLASSRYAKGNISGAVTIDYADGDYQACTMTATVTGITISNLATETGMILLIDNSGGYSVTFGSTEILTTADTGVYICAFYNDNGTQYFFGKSQRYN